jgi:hypothetical protein
LIHALDTAIAFADLCRMKATAPTRKPTQRNKSPRARKPFLWPALTERASAAGQRRRDARQVLRRCIEELEKSPPYLREVGAKMIARIEA